MYEFDLKEQPKESRHQTALGEKTTTKIKERLAEERTRLVSGGIDKRFEMLENRISKAIPPGKTATQEDIASYLGCELGTYVNYENRSKSVLPPIPYLLDLCNLYDCDIAYLLGVQEERKKINTDIAKETGLSESAIYALRNNNPPDGFMDYFIRNQESNADLLFRIAQEKMIRTVISRFKSLTDYGMVKRAFNKSIKSLGNEVLMMLGGLHSKSNEINDVFQRYLESEILDGITQELHIEDIPDDKMEQIRQESLQWQTDPDYIEKWIQKRFGMNTENLCWFLSLELESIDREIKNEKMFTNILNNYYESRGAE